MADGLKNTLQDKDVKSGFDVLSSTDLEPEIVAAMQQLSQISPAPTPEESVQSRATIGAGFAPLQQAIASQAPPSPIPVPRGASPWGQFAGLLAANLAEQVTPGAGKATFATLADQQEQARKIGEINIQRNIDFQDQRTKAGLEVAAKMTEQSIKQAQALGDARAATQAAIQKTKIEDALLRRRQREVDQRAKDNEILQQANATDRAWIAAGFDPTTKKPLTTPMGKTERAAALRGGIDPDTGLRHGSFANDAIVKATNQLRTAKLKKEQKAIVAQDVFRLATERWSNDLTPTAMRNRLLRQRHPLYGVAPKDQRYLITEERVYKRETGKWVLDLKAFERANASAKGLTAPWFQKSE